MWWPSLPAGVVVVAAVIGLRLLVFNLTTGGSTKPTAETPVAAITTDLHRRPTREAMTA